MMTITDTDSDSGPGSSLSRPVYISLYESVKLRHSPSPLEGGLSPVQGDRCMGKLMEDEDAVVMAAESSAALGSKRKRGVARALIAGAGGERVSSPTGPPASEATTEVSSDLASTVSLRGGAQEAEVPKKEKGGEDDEGRNRSPDPSPMLGIDQPSWNGVVFGPETVGLADGVAELREHFEQLKATYRTFQGLTRGMSAGRGVMGSIFPEMWKPFDSSKTWPMCIFYRNPAHDALLYDACRAKNHAVFGDHTSPRSDDPVWDAKMQSGLVDRVQKYMAEHGQAFGLKDKVAFSIQVLWYDTKTRKAEHKDPKAYTVISALNVQGRADLELYDPKKRRTYQSVHLPEGSLYVMHNDAVKSFDHAVSAPDASFKDSRVTMVLRFIDRPDYELLLKEVDRLQRLRSTRKRPKKKKAVAQQPSSSTG